MMEANSVEMCSAPWSKCKSGLGTLEKRKEALMNYFHQSLSLKSIFLGKLLVRIEATL